MAILNNQIELENLKETLELYPEEYTLYKLGKKNEN